MGQDRRAAAGPALAVGPRGRQPGEARSAGAPLPPRGVLDRAVRTALGKDLAALEREIDQGPTPQSRELPGWRAAGKTEVRTRPVDLANVVAVLVEGTGPTAEDSIVVGAITIIWGTEAAARWAIMAARFIRPERQRLGNRRVDRGCPVAGGPRGEAPPPRGLRRLYRRGGRTARAASSTSRLPRCRWSGRWPCSTSTWSAACATTGSWFSASTRASSSARRSIRPGPSTGSTCFAFWAAPVRATNCPSTGRTSPWPTSSPACTATTTGPATRSKRSTCRMRKIARLAEEVIVRLAAVPERPEFTKSPFSWPGGLLASDGKLALSGHHALAGARRLRHCRRGEGRPRGKGRAALGRIILVEVGDTKINAPGPRPGIATEAGQPGEDRRAPRQGERHDRGDARRAREGGSSTASPTACSFPPVLRGNAPSATLAADAERRRRRVPTRNVGTSGSSPDPRTGQRPLTPYPSPASGRGEK